jgi:ribosomal protein S13
LLDRNVGFLSRQHRTRIRRQIDRVGAVHFFNLLTGPELLEMTETHLPEHRERLYPPTVALSMFLKQSLEQDRSCQRAVNAWSGQRAAEGLSVQSVRTGAYGRTRARQFTLNSAIPARCESSSENMSPQPMIRANTP